MTDYNSFTKKIIPASEELNSLYSQFNMRASVARIVGDYLFVKYNYNIIKLPDYVNPKYFPTATSFKLSDLSTVYNYVDENLNTSFEFGPKYNIISKGNLISSSPNLNDGIIPHELVNPVKLINRDILGSYSLTYSNDHKYILWLANDAKDFKIMYAGVASINDNGVIKNVTSFVMKSKHRAMDIQTPSLFVKKGNKYIASIIRNESIESDDLLDFYSPYNDSKLQIWVFEDNLIKIKDSVCLRQTGISTDITSDATRVIVGERNVYPYGCNDDESQVLLYELTNNFRLKLLDAKEYGWRCLETCFAPNKLVVMGSRSVIKTPTQMNLLSIANDKLQLLDTAILSENAFCFEWTQDSKFVVGAGSLLSIPEAPNVLKAEIDYTCK